MALRTLFRSYHNIATFKSRTLGYFTSSIPPYELILRGLQDKNYFINHKVPIVLRDNFGINNPDYLRWTALQLSAQPIRQISHPLSIHDSLDSKIQSYVSILCDIFKNKLSERNYEPGIASQENTSERQHGLQIGKIAYLLGMKLDDVLGLLLHDIARMTVDGDDHGHAVHHLEGSVILAPLGLETNYTFFHGFAKYLLNEFCPAYESLISPVSKLSLQVQKKSLEPQIEALDKLNDETLAHHIQKMMFSRLLDDLCKVPEQELIAVLQPLGREIEYFNNITMLHMLFMKFSPYQNTNITPELNDKLDAALNLMLRAKEFSYNPGLYDLPRQTFTCKL